MIQYISFIAYTPVLAEDSGCRIYSYHTTKPEAVSNYLLDINSLLDVTQYNGGGLEYAIRHSLNSRVYLVGLDEDTELGAKAEARTLTDEDLNYIMANLETVTEFALCTYLHKPVTMDTKPLPSSCERCHKATKVYTALTGKKYCDACWPVYLADNITTGLTDAEFIYGIYEGRLDIALFSKTELKQFAEGWAVARHDNQLMQDDAELDAIEQAVIAKYDAVYPDSILDFTHPY